MEPDEKYESVLSEFDSIEKNFKIVQKNINNIKKLIESLLMKTKESKKKLKNIGVADLIDLPEELRKSVLNVMKFGKATVDQVISRTKRERNLEQGYLEALVAMEYLIKEPADKNGKIKYRLGLGKRKSRVSDDIWKVIIKDSVEMVQFITKMEIEKAQLKIYDIDEMMQMAPQAQADLTKIKDEIEMSVLKINGTEKVFDSQLPATLSALLVQLDVNAETVVAEVDGRIVERSGFDKTELHSGQAIELIRFVPGG